MKTNLASHGKEIDDRLAKELAEMRSRRPAPKSKWHKKPKKTRQQKKREKKENARCEIAVWARSMPYVEYLKTKWWRNKRKQRLEAADHRCERCGKVKQLQVHHKTYARIGCEKHEDLEVLCRACHQAAHGLVENPESCEQADSHLRSISSAGGKEPVPLLPR